MEKNTLIVRYGEVALKGMNKPYFEKVLAGRIKDHINKFYQMGEIEIQRNQGLILVKADITIPVKELMEEISKVFGIASISQAVETGRNIDEIGEAAVDYVLKVMREKEIETFKIEGKRSDKTYPLTSPEISAVVGAKVLKGVKSLKVDIHNPDLLLYIHVRNDCSYIYADKLETLGGLPLGTNGRGMILLSGGIDSPVAAFMMARRGMALEAIHFHSYPYTSVRAQQKVEDLGEVLSQYLGKLRIHTLNLLPAQEEIMKNCPQDEIVLLSRRFMMRLAEKLAMKRDCGFLITGENLGQVASQTAESLIVINASVTMPVLRPLIAYDKSEIIQKAREIGTYETSVEPYEDCCTIFVPKHPLTKPRLEKILESESKIDIEEISLKVMTSLESKLIKIRY